MVFLNVPFVEKDEAKALGARWDGTVKKWYVQNREDYPKFQKWILPDDYEQCAVLCDYFYIVEGSHTCFKCGAQNRVVAFATGNCYFFYHPEEYENQVPQYVEDDLQIESFLEPLNIIPGALDYLKTTYNFHLGFSKFLKKNYFANHCNKCKVIQGQNFLFYEIDSPFIVRNSKSAEALSFHRVQLPFDVIELSIRDDTRDEAEEIKYLIKNYSQVSDFVIENS